MSDPIAVPPDAPTNDAAVTNFQTKFATHYGSTPTAIPPSFWQALLAALSTLLTGCVPVALKVQVKRPLVRARLHRSLSANGIPAGSVGKSVDAVIATVEDSTDEENAAFLAAASEINS